MRFLLVTILATLTAACAGSSLEKTALKPQERQLARVALEDIARGDAKALSQKVTPDLTGKLPVGAMRDQLPKPPFELVLTKANWNSGGRGRSVDAVYSVKGDGGFALVEIAMASNGGPPVVTGLYVQHTPSDPQKLNAFTLQSGGVAGWAMILAMIAAVGATVAALFHIWRSGLFARRWLWTIGAIIGLTTLRLDWSTGNFSFQPISFQFFSASAIKQPVYTPWVLGVSLPLVALIALARRRRRTADDALGTAPPAEND